MKTFYFIRRNGTMVFEVKAKTSSKAWDLIEVNGGRRMDYTRTNSSGTPLHLI